MIEVNVLDSAPGEGELLRNAALYFADRLFTKSQRKKVTIIIDVTAQPIRVPITRDMLMMKKGFVGASPPTMFELTVSTAAGLRDAMEVVAHELIHVSQAHNGRLIITKKKRKYNGEKRLVHMAKWLSGKAMAIEEVQWHNRPWEVEACQWQPVLVTEFIGRSMGGGEAPITQKPKKKQLALFKVAPSLISHVGIQTPVAAPPMTPPMTAPVTSPVTAPLSAPIVPSPVPTAAPAHPFAEASMHEPTQPVPQQTPPPMNAPAAMPEPGAVDPTIGVQQGTTPIQAPMPTPMPTPMQAPAGMADFGGPSATPPAQEFAHPSEAAAPAFGADPNSIAPIADPAIEAASGVAAMADAPANVADVLDDEALIAGLDGHDDLMPAVHISQFEMPQENQHAAGPSEGDLANETASEIASDLPDDLSAALSAEIAAEPNIMGMESPQEAPPASAVGMPAQQTDMVARPAAETPSRADFGATPDLSNLHAPHYAAFGQDMSATAPHHPAGEAQATPDTPDIQVGTDRQSVLESVAVSTPVISDEALADMLASDINDPAIMVEVPGLAEPRLLSQGAVDGKVEELLERGLITAEEAASARSGADPSIR